MAGNAVRIAYICNSKEGRSLIKAITYGLITIGEKGDTSGNTLTQERFRDNVEVMGDTDKGMTNCQPP